MREERIPPVRPRRKFDSLGLSARADVTCVGTFRVRRKTGLHQVERWVVRVVLEPGSRKCAIDDLSDRHPRSLLKHNLCGYAGDERQAAQLDKLHAVVFTLYRRLVSVVLKVLRETGS